MMCVRFWKLPSLMLICDHDGMECVDLASEFGTWIITSRRVNLRKTGRYQTTTFLHCFTKTWRPFESAVWHGL